MPALITLQNVGYAPSSLKSKSILYDINLIIGGHFITTIIGPNGAGKTTLLKILSGLIKPTTGIVRRKKNITTAYVPQQLQANLLIPIDVSYFIKKTLTKKVSQNELNHALHLVGLCHVKHTSFMSLSGGERQRVLIARALLSDAELIILDEPTQGLDIHAMGNFYQKLNQVKKEKQCSIVMVSHDLSLVMDTSDHVICLNHHICCSGCPSTVTNNQDYKLLFKTDSHVLPEGVAPYIHNHDHSHLECSHD